MKESYPLWLPAEGKWDSRVSSIIRGLGVRRQKVFYCLQLQVFHVLFPFCSNFMLSGNCQVAIDTRHATELRRSSDYSQHLTLAKIKLGSLPEEINQSYAEEWKIRLCEDFVNTTILTNEKIRANLLDNKIDLWEVMFFCKSGKTVLKIQCLPSKKILQSLWQNPQRLVLK